MFDCFLAFALGEEKPPESGAQNTPKRLTPVIKYSFPSHVTAIEGMQGDILKLGDFAFPRLAQIQPRRFYRPRTFAFAVTLQDGTHAYGFCRKFLPPGPYERLDVGERYPEVLCFVSKSPEFDLYSSLLDCLHVRRLLSPETMEEFLVSLSGVKGVALGQGFSVRSHSCKLLCEYRFHRPRSGEEGDPSCLIKHLSAYLLHYAMGAVLCERRIVFVGRNEEVLSVCIHGIMALLSPFKWPHIFIPILPECLIQYAAAPSPFIIGVLAEHETELRKQPLGDIVFVDLDDNKIHYGDNSEPVIPFGLSKEKPKKSNGSKPKEETVVFTSELASIYSRAKKNVNDTEQQLKCLWMAFYLYIFAYITSYADDPSTCKVNTERFLNTLDDNDLRDFVRKFAQTQMFDMFVQERFASRKNQTLMGPRKPSNSPMFDAGLKLIRGASTLTEIKRAIQSLFLKRICFDKDNIRQKTLEKTSNSSIVAPSQLVSRFGELARSSYNCVHANCIMHVVWKRIKACSGRNWKYGYNALELLCFLVSAGAESALASILGHIREIYRLMHFELESTIGISKEARSKVRASARRLYGMLHDRHAMQYLRGPHGHKLIKGAKAAQLREAELKLANAVGGVLTDYIPPFSTVHFLLNPESAIKSSSGLEHFLRKGIHPESAALIASTDLLGLDNMHQPPPIPARRERVVVPAATRAPPPPPEVAQAQLHSESQPEPKLHPRLPPPPPEVAVAHLHSSKDAAIATAQRRSPPPPEVAQAQLHPRKMVKAAGVENGNIQEKQRRSPPPPPDGGKELAEKLKNRKPPVPMRPPPPSVPRKRPPAPTKR